MTAFNVVRFKVKPWSEQQFVDAHRKERPAFKGFLGGNLIKTGERRATHLAMERAHAQMPC